MERCAIRLRRSLERLDAFLPIEAGRLQELGREGQEDIDAFLKGFEQLVLTGAIGVVRRRVSKPG